jgi:hypothetical protein
MDTRCQLARLRVRVWLLFGIIVVAITLIALVGEDVPWLKLFFVHLVRAVV